jgi:tellurite resistance protein
VTGPSRDAALFLQLVLGLQQSAMISLGKLMNPITRKIETDLEAARATIDTLAAIEARTRGNLDPDEGRVLQQVLAELRLNYVDELKKAGGAKAAPESSQSEA